jgi:1-deoxy-D-xylulose-5-phosphate reductoisomerase
MLIPIALGLGWPDRLPDAGPACDWTTASTWDFLPLDDEAFPAVALARHVGQEGATYPAVFNAANEECVEAFLAGSIPFLAIVDTVARVVEEWAGQAGNDPGELSVESVLRAEAWARARARQVLVEVPRETVKS